MKKIWIKNNKFPYRKCYRYPQRSTKRDIDKGKGAFFTNGSRPGQTPQSWAYGRLASCYFKQGAYKYDKHILDKYDVKIRQPLKIKNCLSKSLTKKDKRCIRKVMVKYLIYREN